MRDEITDRLGIKSSRIVKCCGRKWDKYTCKSIQFIALFVVMVLTGGAIFQAIEETHAIARARVIATQHSLARARVLTLLRGNETLFSQIAEAATILEGCSSTSKPRPVTGTSKTGICLSAASQISNKLPRRRGGVRARGGLRAGRRKRGTVSANTAATAHHHGLVKTPPVARTTRTSPDYQLYG